MPPGPRPGTLEWHADQRPDELAVLSGASRLSWREFEQGADALAERLARDHQVWPGALLSTFGKITPWWLTLSWAAAKLGAGLAALPPGRLGAISGAVHVSPDALGAPPEAVPRRLSGQHPPPDAVGFSRRGRAVRRSLSPEQVVAVGPTLADLIARLRAAPGTTLAVCGPACDTVLSLLAGVTLVGGGRVACAQAPREALELAAGHGAELVALTPSGLDALARAESGALTSAEREAIDLTAVEALVVGGAAPGEDALALVDDLLGAEALIDVYLTPDTGIAAVRSGAAEHHRLLEGVEARSDAGGEVELRSPLAAAPGWTRTGDAARLTADGGLIVP